MMVRGKHDELLEEDRKSPGGRPPPDPPLNRESFIRIVYTETCEVKPICLWGENDEDANPDNSLQKIIAQ